MGKFLCLIYLLVANFNFAQNSKKDTIVEGKNYYFDVSLDMQTFNERPDGKSRTSTKLINTKDDSYFGFSPSMKQITVFDLKNNYILTFKEDEIEGDKKLKFESGLKFSFKNSDKYKIKVKKLAEKKIQITIISKRTDQHNLKIVANIERSEFDAANSLPVDDMINLDHSVINVLRKKVDLGTFIISDSQTFYDQKAKTTSKILRSERIDLTLTTPKNITLKIP